MTPKVAQHTLQGYQSTVNTGNVQKVFVLWSEVLGILRKTTMNQSGYWRARRLLVATFIKELRTNRHTHTHTHKAKCVSVSGALQKAPVSSRRQLLLLWCYACSLINIDRRVRPTAQHLTVRQGLNLTSSVNYLQNTEAQSNNWSTPLRKNVECISRTNARIWTR